MPSITFDLETVTPLFLAGADQTTAELRPPAFRGALRYWFRAIAASLADEDEVRKWENKVFGNTEAGGSVIIRVQAKQSISNCVLKRDDSFPGLIYLFFSAYGDNKREPRACFPPSSHFKVILQTRLNRTEDQQCLNLAIGAMWMFINLGGIGSRSNRGGGSLKARKETKALDLGINFCLKATAINELSIEIQTGIHKVKELYRNILRTTGSKIAVPTKFDIVDISTSSIYLWQTKLPENNNYWDTILDDFGSDYRRFRLRYKNASQHDYHEIKELLRTGGKSSVSTIKRSAFGLPLQFRFKSLPGKTASVEATGKINRSSSPLHIKVAQLANGQLVILLVHFKTQLLPNNRKLLIKSKSFSKPIECSVPNQEIIDQEFIPFLTTTPVIIP